MCDVMNKIMSIIFEFSELNTSALLDSIVASYACVCVCVCVEGKVGKGDWCPAALILLDAINFVGQKLSQMEP